MKNLISFGLLFVVFFCAEAKAQISFVNNVSNKGTVAAPFLEIGVNARAEGMGGAYTAMKGEPDMIYWNPAGLAFAKGVSGSFSNTQWLANTTFNFAALSIPIPVIKSVTSVSFTTLGVPEQEVRDFSGARTGELWDARDYAVNISFASRLTNNFSFGLSGKYINQRIWSETATGVAFDFGVTFFTPLDGLTMGSSISNFGGDMGIDGKNLFDTIDPDAANEGVTNIPVKLTTDEFPLPQIFRFGLNYEYERELFSAVAAVDLMHPTGSTENMNLGLELGFRHLIFARVGYQNLFERDQINGLTLGTGIKYKLNHKQRFGFDYAYSDWGILGRAHRISMSIYL